MDNYLGDLADIVRASGGVVNNSTITTTARSSDPVSGWDFGEPNSSSRNQQSYELHDLYPFPDPLVQDVDALTTPLPFLENGNNISTGGPMQQVCASAQTSNLRNMYSCSKIVQISPIMATSSPKVAKTCFGLLSNEMMSSVDNGSCSIPKDRSNAGVEISSPPNSGIKRRKSQAKKVVCIPAAAAANSRQTGEVVPSDLWAWRKYGQKPIKGSPYPRGYYRCSSSKGCSARKQVERSRTDPNMLVVTYTSEHNHPWPTQRNALAGSSRSQPSNKGTTPLSSPNLKGAEGVLIKKEINNKEVNHEDDIDTGMVNMPLLDVRNSSRNTTTTTTITTTTLPCTKEETEELGIQMENKIEENSNKGYDGDQEINNYYRPTIMQETNCEAQYSQDFFTNLVEFEGDDPLNILFTQDTNKGSDPFSGFFDWTQNVPNHSGDYDLNNASTSE
ncbi:putative WRKY transcription factor 14 isoform X2 [Silene latifolia]|uniref:putative WRKY transcription factor 14 isoform X2 n=1 Tax=Silene latifolia TaxID=37657 RepID=UPI003D78898F